MIFAMLGVVADEGFVEHDVERAVWLPTQVGVDVGEKTRHEKLLVGRRDP